MVATSDELGIVDIYTYGPFGESGDPGDPANPYRFTGRRLDAETGLYYYRARMYSPALGRFLQPDPIGYAGGLNLYAYVGNDPVNATDPYGNFCPWCLAGFVIGSGAEILRQVVTGEVQSFEDVFKTENLYKTGVAGAAGALGGGLGTATAKLFTNVFVRIGANTGGSAVINSSAQVANNAIEGRDLDNKLLEAAATGAAFSGFGSAAGEGIEALGRLGASSNVSNLSPGQFNVFLGIGRTTASTGRSTVEAPAFVTFGNVTANVISNSGGLFDLFGDPNNRSGTNRK